VDSKENLNFYSSLSKSLALWYSPNIQIKIDAYKPSIFI
jgi:hypothetical protein